MAGAGREVELTAESLAHGGEAIAHLDGQVVFVRGAAPGDRVLARLDADPSSTASPDLVGVPTVGTQNVGTPINSRAARRFLRAKTLRVLSAGPLRTPAPCPIVEQCGGCPIQHLEVRAQREAKRGLAIDALVRLGGLADAAAKVEPIAASPAAFGYRKRARMHRAEDGAWGFAGQDSEGGRPPIVPVDRCLLFEPALQALADAVRPVLAELDLSEVVDLGLLVDNRGRGAVDLRTMSAPGPRVRHKAEQLLRRVRGLRGVVVGPPGEPSLLGEPLLADAPVQIDGGAPFRLRARPDLFAQANRGAVEVLQRTTLEFLGPAAQGRVLELFCGAGTLTLPLLAAGARAVIGVESAGPALGFLRKSADEANLSGPLPARSGASSGSSGPRLQLIAGDAAQVAASLRVSERGALDAVLLDPPRTGAPAAVRAAAELLAPRIVYVSCDAPTLARDARQLAAAGYQLTRARPIDLFPQTAHFETVALFERLPPR